MIKYKRKRDQAGERKNKLDKTIMLSRMLLTIFSAMFVKFKALGIQRLKILWKKKNKSHFLRTNLRSNK